MKTQPATGETYPKSDLFNKARAQLSADMPLQQLGLDSLDYMELMLVVRREFGITLAAEMLIDHPELTLGELCHVIIRQ
ncbi:acyl carrier protein [Serratia nevei]|nr:acyl carrier protein [Serratia nevei]MEC5657028.1 acyl carrier protein [Serratia nevei]